MKKWYDEEYEFEIEVTGFLRGERTERYCRNGEQVGDRYTCTYGCPVNDQGYGICSKTMMMLYPIMEAVRSGGDLENIGGSGRYIKDVVCPDGCVLFRLTARRGSFPFWPELGSRLYQLGRLPVAERQGAAEQYVAEAMAQMPELTVTAVTLEDDRLRVELQVQEQTVSVELTVEGG